MDPDENEGEWKKVEQGNKTIKKVDPYYILSSSQHASLPALSAPPDSIQNVSRKQITRTPVHHQSHYRLKVERRRRKQWAAKLKQLQENDFFDNQITFAEDELTTMAKNDTTNTQKMAIGSAHAATVKPVGSISHRGRNFGYALSTAFKRAIKFIKADDKRVRFAQKITMATYNEDSKAVIISGKFVTSLPFAELSKQAAEADTFTDFSPSLLSVGKTADDGNISIFTKEGVTVHKEKDVPITC